MNRLATNQLNALGSGVKLPEYDRGRLGVGIVHLGIGAFHRAHQAWYTELAMNQNGGDWGITGVSLRSDTVARQLQPQDGLYSLLADDGSNTELRVVGAVAKVLVASEHIEAVLAAIAAPATHIVSLTITEKGYCSDARGKTDWEHHDLARDLQFPEEPTTAIGVLAMGLARRFDQGRAPLTVLSCDNLVENGQLLRQRIFDFVKRVRPEMLDWLEHSVSFPSSMVDRIVPAITEEQRLLQSAQLGADDASAIATEPFSQWVVEDNFAGPRPAWQLAGVTFVDDIRPYEAMKLGLLNAAHTAIACIGVLSNTETVDRVMADPQMGAFVRELMRHELLPGLDVPVGFDLNSYCDALLQRFSNPQLRHRCEQIFMDSSVKIPQRWLPHLQRGVRLAHLELALASWCHLVLNTDTPLDDPAAERMLALRAKKTSHDVTQLLCLAGISPETVEDFGALNARLCQQMTYIATHGLLACMNLEEREIT
ncbi:mannitol dehydrogenase family protein [Halioglobus maricola]|uniref:Mannitol dehydrogenase family protein n=1 Tax=Halioglobus maricola TaxID=2601894 RepID=A0A5P9NLZ7_9GAMM|nr:mannitol dehydrogenase family protein [Halioglobus maricola]QFU75948.1 mannitol dehydrogenase family protein [Halioglobus maricola]